MRRYIKLLMTMVLILVVLSACKTASITDLIHSDTEDIIIGENFILGEDSTLNDYQVDKVLFRPYTIHNSTDNENEGYDTYSINLAVYKESGSKKVTINRITVEGLQDVEFAQIDYDIDKVLEFNEYEKQQGVQSSLITLISNTADYDMFLSKTSKIKITLDVSVIDDKEVFNSKLEYILETRIKTYPVMR